MEDGSLLARAYGLGGWGFSRGGKEVMLVVMTRQELGPD